jgi:hypothetical protein
VARFALNRRRILNAVAVMLGGLPGESKLEFKRAISIGGSALTGVENVLEAGAGAGETKDQNFTNLNPSGFVES